jgi:hypothetical protein
MTSTRLNTSVSQSSQDPGLALRHDMFRKAVDSALFANAKANDANALFTIGLPYLAWFEDLFRGD